MVWYHWFFNNTYTHTLATGNMHLGLTKVHIVFFLNSTRVSVLFVVLGSLSGFAWFILSGDPTKGSNTRASTAVLDRLNWGFHISDIVMLSAMSIDKAA